MSSADLEKRIYLAQVVAEAMTTVEPIDEALFIVSALRELGRPHIRALVRIREAQTYRMASRGFRGSNRLGRHGSVRSIQSSA